jgi:hybrid polyketide synthase/nonribosomal peptide synthetase ACE1
MADLEKAYRGEAPSTVLQYSTFGNSQRQKYQKRQSISELKFWREEFSTIPSPLPPLLPRHTPRVPLRTYSVRRVDLRVDRSLSNRVRQACRQAQATPFHFYLTIFRFLLVQLTGVEELCIGMAEANRKDERMMEESALGPYVNLLPLYFRSEKPQSFLAALTETRKKVYSALANSDVPFEVLLDEIRVPRSTSHSPLFQSFIDYRQGAKEKLSFSNCELEVLHFEAGRTGYDISLDIIDNPEDDCLLMLMTQGSLYTQEETEFLMSSYTHLLTTLAEDVSAPLDIYRAEDKEKALALGKGM